MEQEAEAGCNTSRKRVESLTDFERVWRWNWLPSTA